MKKFGFGTMRLPLLQADDPKSIDLEQVNRMVDYFLANGFTYFDTAYPYHEKTSELAVKHCLVDRYPREAYVLADKMPIVSVTKAEQYEQIFEEQLQKCGVTYFDYYLLHNLGVDRYKKHEAMGAFEFVSRMKAEGKIKKLGFSYHDNAELLEQILTEHPEIDFVQLQLNYLDWESPVAQSRLNYECCTRHGKPVVVMEPVKGGTLANLPADAMKLLAEIPDAGSPASYAIRFAASLDNVFMVLSGMSTFDQMQENADVMRDFTPLTPEEKNLVQDLTDIINRSIAVPCTSCRYCLEVCPIQVNIPVYFGLLNLYHTTGSKTNMYYQRALAGHAKAKNCLHCGLCEKNCPQHIEIRKFLEDFAELYKEQEEKF